LSVDWEKLEALKVNTSAFKVLCYLAFKDVLNMKESTLRRLLGHEWFPVLLQLHRADARASTGDLSHYEFVRSALARYDREPVLPPPLLTGRDLLDMNMNEGPSIGRILEQVRDAQLEGRIGSREEALSLVLDITKNHA